MSHLLTSLQPHVKIDRYANAVFTCVCLWFPLRLHHIICPEQIWENLIFRAWYLFPHVLSKIRKYPDKTTFGERSLFSVSVLTVLTTKLHCTWWIIILARSTANWIWTKNGPYWEKRYEQSSANWICNSVLQQWGSFAAYWSANNTDCFFFLL